MGGILGVQLVLSFRLIWSVEYRFSSGLSRQSVCRDSDFRGSVEQCGQHVTVRPTAESRVNMVDPLRGDLIPANRANLPAGEAQLGRCGGPESRLFDPRALNSDPRRPGLLPSPSIPQPWSVMRLRSLDPSHLLASRSRAGRADGGMS